MLEIADDVILMIRPQCATPEQEHRPDYNPPSAIQSGARPLNKNASATAPQNSRFAKLSRYSCDVTMIDPSEGVKILHSVARRFTDYT